MAAATAHAALLAVIGLLAGTLGTTIGLGGGFVVVPVLRLFYGLTPAVAAGISLVMILANVVSGSLAYARQGRVDVRAALLVAATAIPASVLRTYFVDKVSVDAFDALYGSLLAFFFIDVVRRRTPKAVAEGPIPPGMHERVLVDRAGERFRYYSSVPLLLACGVAFGFVSSFFGIGGGVISVMFFIALLRMPPHVCTATSTVAILLNSPAGVVSHALSHDVRWAYALPLAAGGMIGGQLGPQLARRLPPRTLLVMLAATILLAGVAVMLAHVV